MDEFEETLLQALYTYDFCHGATKQRALEYIASVWDYDGESALLDWVKKMDSLARAVEECSNKWRKK